MTTLNKDIQAILNGRSPVDILESSLIEVHRIKMLLQMMPEAGPGQLPRQDVVIMLNLANDILATAQAVAGELNKELQK